MFYSAYHTKLCLGAEFECELRWPSSNRSQVKDSEKAILTGLNKLKEKIQASLLRWVKEFNEIC